MHGGAGDAGRVEVVEQGHVGICGAEFLDPAVEGVEKIFYVRDLGRGVGESAEEEQRFVEAAEVVGVGELEF